MRTTVLLLWLLILGKFSNAEFRLHIIATVPVGTARVMVAGSFNNFTSGNFNYKMMPLDGSHFEITLTHLRAAVYSFKCTRGNGTTVECQQWGMDAAAHKILLQSDTTIFVQVAAWSDTWFDTNTVPDSMRYDVMMNRAGYYVELNLDSSEKYAGQVYQLSLGQSPMKQARALDLQAVIFTRQGNGEKALSLLLKSLELKKSLGDSSTISFVYYNIGNIYEGFNDYAKAMEYYRLASSWVLDYTGPYKSLVLMKMSRILFRWEKTDSATYLAARALTFDSTCVGALLMMGDLAGNKKNTYDALKFYSSAAMASAASSPGNALFTNAAEAYTKMALCYYSLARKDSSFYYARKAFALASNVKNPYLVSIAATGLATIFQQERKFDSALFYVQLAGQKKDSLLAGEKERQVHTIVNNEKFRQQQLAAEQDKYNLRLKLYGLLVVFMVLIMAAIAYRIRTNAAFKKRMAELEMQALRAQMNPHFIFNCLASINRYIVKSDARTASAYLTKFAKLIRLILENSASEFIELGTEIRTLTLYLDMELLRFDHSFEYCIQHDGITLTDTRSIPTMVLQPYVENAIWHGLLHNEKSGKLWIRFIQELNQVIRIEIEDNGIGRKKAAGLKTRDAVKNKSFGMRISQSRIDIINKLYPMLSSVTIEDLYDEHGTASGTKIILHLPFL